MTRYVLLGLLREEGDYGYRLKRRFDERGGGGWQLNIGQVYQALATLQAAGLVAASAAPAGGGVSASRRRYEITPKGIRALERWLRRPSTRIRPVRNDLLLKLLVAGGAHQPHLVADIDLQEMRYRQRLQDLRRAQEQTSAGAGYAQQLALDAELLHIAAELEWLEHCRRMLEDGPGIDPPSEPR